LVKESYEEKTAWFTIKLVLDDVVENFEEEEHEVVIGWIGVEEPRR